MIHKIYANNKKFKEIKFKKGMNIILAVGKKSEGQKSRNGVGKTTLIHILHFCLGSNLNKKILPVDEIKDWTFTIELDINNEKIVASRSIDNSSKIKVEGNFDKLPIMPEFDSDNDFYFYKVRNWNNLLGKCLFGIKESGTLKYHPSFRTLIPYFIRREEDYKSPFKNDNNDQGKAINWKINTAFLLGLNWKLLSEYQSLEDKSKELEKDKNLLNAFGLDRGELEPQRLRLEKEIIARKNELDTFEVHESYENIENNANRLTNEIHNLSNENIFLKQKLQKYQESIIEEKDPNISNFKKLYEEAGMVFPDNVKKTLDDAKIFHKTIIKNRKNFLKSEIIEIEFQISNNKKNIELKAKEKAKNMNILNNFGALKEYTDLQGIFSEKIQQLEEIKSNIKKFKHIDSEKIRVNESKTILENKIQIDYDESQINREKAIELFSENSRILYGVPGNLIINPVNNGYKFDIDIHRSQSGGIKRMTIFCYDLMLVELFNSKNKIDFLIHDSTLFNGVDERQFASAFRLAIEKGNENGFQYICSLNSDTIPYSILDDLDIERYIRLKLDDKSDEGFILGFEF